MNKNEVAQDASREAAPSACRGRPRGSASLERPRYSQSELKTFLKCGRMWEFRYLQGIKTPPTSALTLGSAVDGAVSANLAQKIESGQDMSTAELLDHYSNEFDQRKYETDWKDEDPGEHKDIGVKLVEVHHREAAPKIEPATVQERFVIETDAGYDLEGTMDLTEKSGMIVDVKTSRTAYSESAIEKEFQPALYDFAYEQTRGEPAKGFRYDVLVKPTSRRPAELQQVEGKVSACDREWLFGTISQVHKAIQAGVALPAPEGSWYCSAKWCGYWNQCKGRKYT